jgi:hypothetical protein
MLEQCYLTLSPEHRAALKSNSLPQKWGQLMGSITSFPILCLINAAICRKAYEIGHVREYPFGLSLREMPVTINGDDGLFTCNELTYKTWEKIAELGGLSPSVGKVYFHESYMNINSTSFVYKEGRVELVKYVNMGLLKGYAKSNSSKKLTVKSAVGSKDDMSIGARHRDLINFCPEELKLTVHDAFLKEHHSVLSRIRIPWYLPEYYGGLGLEPFFKVLGDNCDECTVDYYCHERTGARWGPSELDLKCARALSNNYLKGNFKSYGVETLVEARGVWLKENECDLDVFYKTNVQAYREGWKEKWEVERETQQSAEGNLDVSVLYLRPEQALSVKETDSVLSLRHNERQWTRLSHQILSMRSLAPFDRILPGFSGARGTIIRGEVVQVLKAATSELDTEL